MLISCLLLPPFSHWQKTLHITWIHTYKVDGRRGGILAQYGSSVWSRMLTRSTWMNTALKVHTPQSVFKNCVMRLILPGQHISWVMCSRNEKLLHLLTEHKKGECPTTLIKIVRQHLWRTNSLKYISYLLLTFKTATYFKVSSISLSYPTSESRVGEMGILPN